MSAAEPRTPLESPTGTHESTTSSQQKPQRRVRKGTRSCWECRHRKIKCVFRSPSDNICVRCTRRGAKCVSQEQPEVISAPLDRALQMGDRVVRIEALVNQMLKEVPKDSAHSLPTPPELADEESHDVSTSAASRLGASCEGSSAVSDTGSFQFFQQNSKLSLNATSKFITVDSARYMSLSQTLHESLPPTGDVRAIVKACGNTSSMFFEMQSLPYSALDDTKSLQTVFEAPGPDAHPVLLARHMIHIATALQHLHPDFHEGIRQLSAPPLQMMHSLVRTANENVTIRDDLIDNIEGLDLLGKESWYHANNGDLRKALVTIRRAITIAQVMGLHRASHTRCKVVSSNTKAYPESLWLRIVTLERYLCLMLGLPQVTIDQSMASEAMLDRDTPMGQLERAHCAIAARILERNHSDPEPNDYATTKGIDEQLRQASERMPPDWWLTPNLATTVQQPDVLFLYMRRLFNHLFHYSLLIQLHLPYMLRSCVDIQRHDYSWVTCVTAAREILSRLVMYHSFNRIAFCCRTLDFFGLMASIALLIAHIEKHRLKSLSKTTPIRPSSHVDMIDGLLSHQRPCDRALVKKALRPMEDASRFTTDAMGIRCSALLRQLLSMENEAANLTKHGHVVNAESNSSGPKQNGDLQLTAPFFGIITITPKGVVLREPIGTITASRNTCEVQSQRTMTSDPGHSHTQALPSSIDSGMLDTNQLVNGDMAACPPHTISNTHSYHTSPSHDILQIDSAVPGTALAQYTEPLLPDTSWTSYSISSGFLDTFTSAVGGEPDVTMGSTPTWLDACQFT
ncbi:hypothetical protein GGR57DRAFT_395895 [Xylariaceae sp. FL1272]|nr:hypothetical protein GGR57DRAFT_395895 [Xylariaceae sp. FL1272]